MSKIRKFNEDISQGLSEENAEQLWSEIENEGLGYWVQHYGYKGTEDPKLVELCEKAKLAMNELDSYTQAIFDKYNLG